MRLEVTRKSDLATRVLIALASDGAKHKGSALAERLDASPGFLAQAITPLVNARWVRSEPGPNGGYTLIAHPDEVSVRAVIEAVEGPTDTFNCVLQDRLCSEDEQCPLHRPWSAARAALLSELEAMTVTDLVTQRTNQTSEVSGRGRVPPGPWVGR